MLLSFLYSGMLYHLFISTSLFLCWVCNQLLGQKWGLEEPTVAKITRKAAQTSKPSLTPNFLLHGMGGVLISSGLWHTEFSVFMLLTLQCAVLHEERHTCGGFIFFLHSWGWPVAELPGQSILKCFSLPSLLVHPGHLISPPPFFSCKNGLSVWFKIILMFVQWPRF